MLYYAALINNSSPRKYIGIALEIDATTYFFDATLNNFNHYFSHTKIDQGSGIRSS